MTQKFAIPGFTTLLQDASYPNHIGVALGIFVYDFAVPRTT